MLPRPTWLRVRVPLGAALAVLWVLIAGAYFATGRTTLGMLLLAVAVVWAFITYRWWTLGDRP